MDDDTKSWTLGELFQEIRRLIAFAELDVLMTGPDGGLPVIATK